VERNIFKATLEPSGREFLVDADESILNCALRQRILLQYGCRNGRCSSCKYFLIEGDVDFGKTSPYSLSESEKEEGWALLCQARPLSDLVIRDHDVSDRDQSPLISPENRSAEVAAVRQMTPSLWGFQLALDHPLAFYPGQFIEIEIPHRPGSWRCYSIASSPARPDRIDLVVKRIEGGALSGSADFFKPGLKLKIRGPYGDSYLRASDRPVILAATGSGVAPIISILRASAELEDPRRFEFYYGARTLDDLIFRDELEALERRMAHFSFRPVLSANLSHDTWPGRTGRITQAIQREVSDASPCDAYICGRPEMCESVALLLLAKGIAESRIFRDDFFAAA
jgi:NAD(P)H-flavin reductase/ferredoxin